MEAVIKVVPAPITMRFVPLTLATAGTLLV